MKPELRDNPLCRLALTRPVMVMMMFLSVLVVGTVAVLSIPLEMIPSGLAPPVMTIQVPYSNATAQDVEEKITLPLEQSIATTPHLDELISTSSGDSARITMIFEQDADMDIAYREVRDRVARVRAELPDDVRSVNIRKQSADAIPVAFYGVRWPEGMEDEAQELIEKRIVQRLERVDGVGLVGDFGKQQREIRIEVDRELAEAANLNIFEIAQKLSTSHFNLASGDLVESDGRFLVRSIGTYADAQALEQAVVGPNDLRLGDVAQVKLDFPDTEFRARWNGSPSMALFVIKESQANTVDVCDAVDAEIAEIQRDPSLQQLEIKRFFSQGEVIRTSLGQVVDAGLQGGLLAVVVLLFFLQRVRLTVVIAGSIPLSIFMSLPVMYFSGQSINLISLIGLMICIGLVVDNAVVVAENVQRYRARGVGRFTAALHGTSEVALPVALATSTTMIVFLPAALISTGTTRFFMIRMVTPVCVSLLASLFVALVLIPMAAAFVYDKDPFEGAREGSFLARLEVFDRTWKRALDRVYEATLGRLRDMYARLLRGSLHRRMDVALVGLLALASVAFPFSRVPSSLQDDFGGRQVQVDYVIPSDVSVDEADEFFREIERWFDEHRHEYGSSGNFIFIEEGFAEVSIFFDPPRPGDPPFREQGKKIFDQLPVPPGWTKRSRVQGSDGAQSQVFPVFIFGDDHATVQEAKEKLELQIVEVPGVVSIQGSGRDTSRRDELSLYLDRGVSERFGVSAGQVANTIAYAIRGSPLPRFYTDERAVDVWIRYEKADREELSDLLEFKVLTPQGQPVTIRNLTEKEVTEGEAVLVRNNKRVADRINLELDSEDRQAAVANLQRFLDSYDLPEGVSFDADRERGQLNDQMTDFALAMLLGSVFIFLLMAFLFESFVLPLSVMPSIPLAFVGVWWFLWATDESIDPLTIVGILLLLGVVVNNGIVLVDFINIARRQGLSREDAVVQAGLQRFRPILMTALTTVGGMIPLAFSQAPAEGIPYTAFGKTLVGGMTTATVLTLLVVPVFYTLFDDLQLFMRDWFARLMRRPGGGGR